MLIRFPPAGTTPPTHVAGEDHIPPIAEAVYVAGTAEVKLMLSIAIPGEVPNELSFCQVKIKRNVVPAKEDGSVTVALVYVACAAFAWVYNKVAPGYALVLDAGYPEKGVVVTGAA
jgi:hypothetical protein